MYGRKYGEESDSYGEDQGRHKEKHGGYIKKSYIPVPYTINVRKLYTKGYTTNVMNSSSKYAKLIVTFRAVGTNAWDHSITTKPNDSVLMFGIVIATATSGKTRTEVRNLLSQYKHDFFIANLSDYMLLFRFRHLPWMLQGRVRS